MEWLLTIPWNGCSASVECAVWGSEGEDDLAFDSLDHLNRVLGLVMEHYNDVARTLIERPDRYGLRFAVDKRHNEILWEIWVAGFEKAVKLPPAVAETPYR